MMRKAFTLVELMVVLGMVATLAAAMGVSVGKAQTRAKIAKATQEAKELTNAILAFEQYAKGHSLSQYAGGSWSPCTEGNMKMVLGKETGDNGEQVPVLYNGSLTDPWGHPYQIMIQTKAKSQASSSSLSFKFSPALPNYFRLSEADRQ